jgi:uncharacterized protein (TIGR03435 family)
MSHSFMRVDIRHRSYVALCLVAFSPASYTIDARRASRLNAVEALRQGILILDGASQVCNGHSVRLFKLRIRIALMMAGCLAFGATLRAKQNVGASPVFEVASIKPNKTMTRFFGGRCRGIDSRPPGGSPANNVPLGRCVLRYQTLKDLLAAAYGLGRGLKIVGGPAWVTVDRYDIEAKAEDPDSTHQATLYQMLRSLLVERFKLKVHPERRDIDGLALVVDKEGLRVAPSEYSAERAGTFSISNGTLIGTSVAMTSLADELSFWANRPVVDQTGMRGYYDIRLKWTPGMGEIPFPPTPPPPSGSNPNSSVEVEPPSLFSAIRQQLGLRLEARKVSVEFLVIDSAQKPSPN